MQLADRLEKLLTTLALQEGEHLARPFVAGWGDDER